MDNKDEKYTNAGSLIGFITFLFGYTRDLFGFTGQLIGLTEVTRFHWNFNQVRHAFTSLEDSSILIGIKSILIGMTAFLIDFPHIRGSYTSSLEQLQEVVKRIKRFINSL